MKIAKFQQRVQRCATVAMLLAISGCGGKLPPPAEPSLDAKFDLFTTTAQVQFQQDSLLYAAADFAKALDRARIIDQPLAIRSAAFNLAICDAALGLYDDALTLLQEAARESARAKLDPIDIELATARVQLLKQNWTTAHAIADHVLAANDAKPADEQKIQALLIRGEAERQTADIASAQKDLAAAQTLLKANIDSPSQAGVSGLAGELHLVQKDFPGAEADFDRQAFLCRANHQYREMTRALINAGHAAASAGKPAESADRLYRAARAAASRGDAHAASLQTEALAEAESANETELIHLITALKPPATKPATTDFTAP